MSPVRRARARAPRALVDAAGPTMRKRARAKGPTDEKENDAPTSTPAVGAPLARAKTLEDLTYDGEIVVASTAEALDEALARIEAFGDGDGNGSARGRDCGFDMEWKVSFKKGSGEAKTSLVQIAAANDDLSEKLVVLGRIHTAGLTRRFKRWIRDSTRGKTGFNVRGDAKKLIRDFGLETSRVIELSALARERYEGGCPSAPSWSLARLCEHALGKTLPKDKTRMSNWEREELKEEQIKYAAMDAWASLLVYRALRARDLVHSYGDEPYECDPLPEPMESSEEELAEEDDEDDDEDEEERFVEDEDIDEDVEDAIDGEGTVEDAKGELSAQSKRASDIDLTQTEKSLYDRHMSGESVRDMAAADELEEPAVLNALIAIVRKGCAFYFDLMCVPEHLTLYFNDFVTLNGKAPPSAAFASFAGLDEKACRAFLIALAVKWARDRE